MGKKKQKLVLPPELPPEVPDEDIEVSDEDLQFFNENLEYAGFVSNLDTHSITKHVTRVADAKEGDLESLYEKRLRKRLENKEKEPTAVEVDPVDALPVKTLDGQLYYRRVAKEPKEAEPVSGDPALVKLTKAEKRAKLKKLRKEAKKQAKEEVQQTPQAEVLDEVKKDLTAEEATEMKKYKLAELGTALLADPESNIKNIKEMLEISKDGNSAIVILGLKSLLAVFKDIIPGYRIRLPTEKEQEMKVSKAVKKMRFYESTLLSAYKAYVQKLVSLQHQAVYKRVAVRCLCTLLAAVPHFNFRDSLLAAVVKNITSQDDVVRKLCGTAVKSLFMDEGKHGGEATVEAVKMIAELVKAHNCQLHPDSVEVFLSLSFDEDLGKSRSSDMDNRTKNKNSKKRKGGDEPNDMPNNQGKKIRKEMISKTREEVSADFKAASLAQDPQEQRRLQSQTLSAVFQTYFRILKHAVLPISETSSVPGASRGHPLLASCLNGIGKFSHLIDLDFMADLMHCLRKLAGRDSKLGDSSENYSCLTVSERLRCCIVAFKVMRNNLDALNVDLQEFFVQLYNLILEFRPGRDQGEVLAEALKIMLCDDRQHDMQRAAAFIKRLSTFSLCFGSAESMAALVTVKHLLLKNVNCRNLLDNDAGGGSVAGAIAKYQPHAVDPNRSGALASVLWELNVLLKHYHPAVSSIASGISTMNMNNSQVYHSHVSPQQAYMELSQENMSFAPPTDIKTANNKRQKGMDKLPVKVGSDLNLKVQFDENEVRKKLAEHFFLLRDIQENERLRSELDRTTLSLNLYERYKKRKKRKTR
ncbi:Protein involved in the nuclear export of pre-ribosome [Handroanthus impetiginosus]|uniref:Protein involved in the nuclear export of pre-ribosome n=1 Tax=Handroanthus impetiginosus TaxID=429701 RepID=A0A2G9GYL0_9LAMI|nr:Protein involved in the nuclear export of pre-ribosome [Handroanthus impetiginosus]